MKLCTQIEWSKHSKGTLHADSNSAAHCQICAFGKYENGFPLLETMPAKSGRKFLHNLLRLTTSKEACDPVVRRVYIPIEMKRDVYKKRREEKEGTERICRRDHPYNLCNAKT